MESTHRGVIPVYLPFPLRFHELLKQRLCHLLIVEKAAFESGG
jgi:hypothetical protein